MTERRLSLDPDPWNEWIYRPEYRDDPRARDLRARRAMAIAAAPDWMRALAVSDDQLGKAETKP